MQRLRFWILAVVLCFSFAVLSVPATAASPPIAGYAFNEGSGLVARDTYGTHTAAAEKPSWVEGKYGKALSFNGESSCVSVPSTVDLQLSEEFTLEAWVKPDHNQEFAPVFFKEAESFYSYSLFVGAFKSGHLEGYVADEPWEWSEVESPEVMPAKTWTHIAMTSDGTTLRLYVNGKQVDSAPARNAMESKGPLYIGCAKAFGEYFAGQIDEVRIYERALIGSELETDKGTAIATAPLEAPTASYPFDDLTPSGGGSTTTAFDALGNHDGQIEGATADEGKYGYGLDFTGKDCVSVPNSVDLQLSGSFTLEAWVNPDHSQEFAPVFFKEAESFYSYSLFLGAFNSGHLEGFIANEPWKWTEVESPELMPAKTWTHIAMTSDGTTLRLYVNGKQVDSGPAAKAMESKGPLLIGCAKTFGEYFEGKIDEVRIYNRALSGEEVTADKETPIYQPAPVTSKVTSPSEGATTARWLRLKAGWEVAGVTGITYQFREGSGGPFHTIPAGLVHKPNGESISWPIPIGAGYEAEPLYFDALHASSKLRKAGGKIQVRALFRGPSSARGYSVPGEAKVSRSLGGPGDATAQVGPGTVDLLTGNLAVTRTDVAIPGFTSSLEFSRTLNSRDSAPSGKSEGSGEIDRSVLGQGWKTGAPVEAGNSEWRSVRLTSFSETFEVGEEEFETYSFEYAILTDLEGAELSFEKQGASYATPPELSGWTLVEEGAGRFVLSDPGGNQTTFENIGGGAESVPVSVSQSGGAGNTTKMVFEVVGGQKRLEMIIAPSAQGISCTKANAMTESGCHALKFTYAAATTWGAPASYGDRLKTITYYAPGNGGHWDAAEYKYNSEGRLIEEWDPRISPPLKEKYSYETGGQLKTITPPGQEPWTMEYGVSDEEEASGRLVAVKRASLLASPSTAQTTISYGVPITGSGAPYDLSQSAVSKWGQRDLPTDATAVFPPDQVPSTPPSSYSRATLYYMDPEGHAVNTATPSGAGTSAPSITTSEVNAFGNVTRELSAQNRLRALAAGSESIAKSHQLETKRRFNADGTRMEEEWGPLHQVRLESGTTTQARFHRLVKYDEGAPVPPGGMPKFNVPTRETTGAAIPGNETDADQRVTETHYNWTLRKPTETIVDPGEGHLSIRTVTVYDETSGLPIEQRQPSDPEGKKAGTTKTIYYSASGMPGTGACVAKPEYANLPCEVLPAAQPGTAGQPKILVRKFPSYNALGQPLEVIESPGGEAGNTRKTISVYDGAGRPLTKKIEGGGTAVSKTETIYNETTGAPTTQRFKCEEKSCTGFDTQATTATYDALGRPKEYEDADGNVAKTTYDLDGRPVTISDGKGSQTMTYDPTSGLPVKLEDSAAGTFTAAYDADGNLTERILPDGLTAKTTYNEAGEATHLTYTKASSCGTGCTWYDEGIERSIYGQDLSQTGTLANYLYTYDKAGRLATAAETPTGGTCTTRSYSFDADSNRLEKTTRSPGLGTCSWSGGTTQKYKYDAADRLEGPTYDGWGRITSLPAEFAGGKALTTKYFSTDMVAEQTQNGVTNTFQLDGALRQRQRVQAGGIEGVEVFHYDNGSDSPAWTQLGSTWTRNITGIGGELCGVQESGSGTTLRVTNLHGDVVAKASLSPAETKLLATYRFDEFGNPVSGSAGRLGWLGGRGRRTELPSGVVQMGARSYVPAVGRFISTDPIRGGSANAYDYTNADPVNGFDLAGTKPYSKACDPGFVGCKCILSADFEQLGHHRMRLQWRRACNVASSVTKTGWAIAWGKGNGSGFSEISAPPSVRPPEITAPPPVCHDTDPCQKNQHASYTFHCEPGKEYQFSATWGYSIAFDNNPVPESQLQVSVQQFCL